VPDGIKRMALEQIESALDQTKTRSRKLDDAVHDTRVCFKKLRGLLRLVRYDLGDKKYQQENSSYRNANRRLSSVRDTAAMAETLDKLKERFVDQLAEDAFQSVRKSLTRSKRKRQAEKKKTLADVGRTIVAARKRVEKWSLAHNGFGAVGQGLTDVYKQGRLGFANAYRKQRVKDFHEWRKQVKYLWYHVRLLRQLWPEPLKNLADELETLTDYLSDDHDLALLRDKVLEQSGKSDDGTEIEALVALIDQHRGELQVKAKVLGARIYAEKPAAFVGRTRTYWQAWRWEVNVDPTEVS